MGVTGSNPVVPTNKINALQGFVRFDDSVIPALWRLCGAFPLDYVLSGALTGAFEMRSFAFLLVPFCSVQSVLADCVLDINVSVGEQGQVQWVELGEDDAKWLVGAAFDSPSHACLLYTSPSPRDATLSRMPSSA